ncbi:MAG: hypothetical protein HW405_235, partial [Candidatus Berkelbacteria bacterium]|nr:hypothetical protein [Candidatus Berkelbacteria bacterium]
KFDEAVWFLEKFINDSDPPRDGKNYPDDLKGDWNYHQKLKDGDDEMVITTVRGWCGQVLSSLAVAGNQKGMPGVIKIAEKLSRDPNNYVRYELCTSLSHIVKNRRTYLPGEKKIPFLKKEDSKKIENTVFYMLRDKRNHKIKALMKRLIDVFGGMRGISETEAKEFLKTVLDTKMDEVIAEAVPFFVYFAEFRENDFKSDTIKELYTDKWDSIKDFKDQSFKKLIEDLIKKGFPATKANLAWQFCNLPNEDKGNESLIKISFKYLNKLANINYNHEVYERIYSFIEDQNDKYAKESLALWKKCLEKEKPAIKKLSKDKGDENRYNWYPYYYNENF